MQLLLEDLHRQMVNTVLPLQVRHRCTCTDKKVCGEEAALVEKLSKQSRLVVRKL